MDVRLVSLPGSMKEQYMDYYLEWNTAGEKMNPGILRNMNPDCYEETVKTLHELELGKGEREVPESVYFLVNEKNRILGARFVKC